MRSGRGCCGRMNFHPPLQVVRERPAEQGAPLQRVRHLEDGDWTLWEAMGVASDSRSANRSGDWGGAARTKSRRGFGYHVRQAIAGPGNTAAEGLSDGGCVRVVLKIPSRRIQGRGLQQGAECI